MRSFIPHFFQQRSLKEKLIFPFLLFGILFITVIIWWNYLGFREELKPEILTGNLGAYSDGTIRYKKEIIKMRNQLKDLCRLFMNHPDRLLTIDDIRDTIIKADKRILTPFTTIAKYVSELHNSLKIHFKKDVIFNQKEEGWYFKP